MKIDKITGSVPNCIACQIGYDNNNNDNKNNNNNNNNN